MTEIKKTLGLPRKPTLKVSTPRPAAVRPEKRNVIRPERNDTLAHQAAALIMADSAKSRMQADMDSLAAKVTPRPPRT